ncbi:unnamed protein product [Parajaminaea phylloscopi]
MVADANGTSDSHPTPAARPSEPLLRHLLDAVSRLPREALPAGSGHLTISVIFSPARVAKVLYPWAHLEAPREVGGGTRPFPEQTVKTWEEMIFVHAEWRRDDEDEDDSKMICAIEAYNYTLPEHGAAVFYLSKLDTSGWGPRLHSRRVQRHLARLAVGEDHRVGDSSKAASSASSLTGYLTSEFLAYFLALRHVPRIPVPCVRPRHISLHILARAQAAYIFPNSPENSAKKPLSDSRLIVWWRETLSQVIDSIRSPRRRIDAFYMIPGLEKLESHPLVPLPTSSAAAPQDTALSRAKWTYGHPYTLASTGLSSVADLPPLPLHLEPAKSERSRGIATLLPRFEDDPQSRFLDELAGEGQEIGKYADLIKPAPHAESRLKDPSTAGAGRAAPAAGDSQATLVNEPNDSQTTFIGGPSQDVTSTSKEETTVSEAESSSTAPDGPSARATPKRHRLSTLERLESDSGGAQSPRRSPRNLSPSKSTLATPTTGSQLRSPRKGGRASSQTGSASPSRGSAREGGTRLTQVQQDALRSRLSLDNVSPDEFWVRMGFRQECSSGSLVGAFFVGVTSTHPPNTVVIEPQLRPTHTIPVRELQKTVRNCLQLDDCWWNKDRESIELTQEFDEERGRLLAHLGRLNTEVDQVFQGEEGWKNGRGTVWDSAPMQGYDAQMVQKAVDAAEEEATAERAKEAQAPTQRVTMLNVKRKRK